MEYCLNVMECMELEKHTKNNTDSQNKCTITHYCGSHSVHSIKIHHIVFPVCYNELEWAQRHRAKLIDNECLILIYSLPQEEWMQWIK